MMDEPTTLPDGDPRFHALLARMGALHAKKSRDYGSSSDPLANLRAAADVGIAPALASWLRAKDKVYRIDAHFKRGNLVNESVEDSLQDLAAYCLLTLMLMEEGK